MKVATPLQQKLDGKVSWNVPTADDVSKLLDASQAFVTAFDNFVKFVADKSGEIAALKTVPLTAQDVTDLQNQLEVVKKMPFD